MESNSPLLKDEVRPYYRDYISHNGVNEYQSLHITFYDNSSRSYVEVQLRTKEMDDVAEIGSANHRLYEKAQEKDRSRREAIPEGECRYFDDAYERGMKLLNLQLKDLDAISGTTPPYSVCSAICEEITLDNTSLPFFTTAAAVSSQELSIARISKSFFSSILCLLKYKLNGLSIS